MLVVFIDDLDRCSPANVLQVFEAIRLYLDAPGLVFVIGYDDDVVSDGLVRSGVFADPAAARRYLEKILQVDLTVPVPTLQESIELARESAKQCGVEDLLNETDIALVAQHSYRNPRRVKRFLNTFVLSRNLDPGARSLRPDEHLRIVLLRMYFPELFHLLLTEEGDTLNQLVEAGRLRKAATAGHPLPAKDAEALFDSAGVQPPQDGEDPSLALDRLEQNLPPMVRELSRNSQLLSLAFRMGTVSERQDLVQRLRERPPALTLPAGEDLTLIEVPE